MVRVLALRLWQAPTQTQRPKREPENDGHEEEFGPGDVMIVPPGHDAWVVGDEDVHVIDWQGFADYAKR